MSLGLFGLCWQLHFLPFLQSMGAQRGLYHLGERLISITEINLEKFHRVQQMWPWICLSTRISLSPVWVCVQHNQSQYLQTEWLMEKSNRNGLSSVSWLRISDVGAAWHSRDGGSRRAGWSAPFWMLLLEDEKYRSARDLEYGIGDMECVWICHKGGVSINKPLCVQMVALSRRLQHRIAIVCSPVVEWEQPQTFDQNTLTSSCCLDLLYPQGELENVWKTKYLQHHSLLFSSGNSQCLLKNLAL